MRQLWGTGFNTRRHLVRSDTASRQGKLIPILSGDSITILYAGWDYTFVLCDDTVYVFGTDGRKNLLLVPAITPASRLHGFWAVDGILQGCLSTVGDVYLIDSPPESGAGQNHDLILRRVDNLSTSNISHLAWTNEGSICIALDPYTDPFVSDMTPSSHVSQTTILHFSTAASFRKYLDAPEHSLISTTYEIHTIPDTLISLSSSATSFAALTTHGSVYTWGSALQLQMLGREAISPGSARAPAVMDMLEGLFIRKVAMCEGWLGAAVTRDGDVYMWGDQPGGGIRGAAVAEGTDPLADDGVRLCTRDEWKKVTDVGVGLSHIAVVVDGSLLVTGKGSLGQLGLGTDMLEIEAWKEVDGGSTELGKVVEVVATRWDTFAVTELD